jgi:hypothetical protein
MSFPARWTVTSGGSGTLAAAPVAGTTTGGTGFGTANVQIATLSCLFTVTAGTATLTLEGKFQVSDDNSTWRDLAGDAQNPANVVMATAVSTVNMVLPVPISALGWRYIRAAVVNRVATGAVADTYAFEFHYRAFSGF